MTNIEINVRLAEPTEVKTALLVVTHYEDDERLSSAAAAVDTELDGTLSQLIDQGDFRGKADEALVVYPRSGEIQAERVLLLGLGSREGYSLERLRRTVGTAVRQAERVGAHELTLPVPTEDQTPNELNTRDFAETAAEAATLAAWRFDEFKTKDDEPRRAVTSLTLTTSDEAQTRAAEEGARYGQVVAASENLARDLASRPGNVATPSHLAKIARDIAETHALELTVLDRKGIEEEGMEALLAVAQGTDEEPRFIVLEYHGKDADPERKPLVLVGKGVTFDTGGISLKPGARMEDMKYDMSGAAAVLGATRAIAELELPVHLVTIVPTTENMPSGRALKPGDVIGSRDGKTIEVINTDAEGRLILVDALSYARDYEPEAILNAATLTGACVIALGHQAVGLMGNDDTLIDEIRTAGDRTGERCWPLPLWDEYRKQLDSDFADIKNVGGRPAGTITAGWFLKEFVGETPWAHLDIAGTAYRAEATPYLRKGATGIPTRLFVEWVRTRADR